MKKLHEFYTAGTGTALLVGNPTASAINAPKGQRLNAYKDAAGNVVGDSHVGGVIGALSGAGLGGAAGVVAGPRVLLKNHKADMRGILKSSPFGKANNLKVLRGVGGATGVIGGGIIGASIGSLAGNLHGHFGKRAQEIRNRHLSANLKPALRELAARSEEITEFAMVRDASGRYVEVEEDGGMGVGSAIKAGAGAAALGGAGYGAYKGHQAIMGAGSNAYAKNAAFNATAADRVGGVSAVPRAQSNANFKLAKAKAVGDFNRMGFMDKVKTGYGMAGKSAMNSAASKPGLLGKLGRLALKLR